MAVLLISALLAMGVAAAARWLKRPLDQQSLILFFCLPVIFLLPGFFADRTPIPLDHARAHFPPWNAAPHPFPHNPSLNDVATQFAPWAKAVRMAWKEGSLPFWNRWNGCGMPLAANGQSQAFSPLTFLMFALPLGRAFVLLGASKLFLALSGTWLWLRQLGTSAMAARFGAICFAFSFAITPWLYHPATAAVCLWLWIFFAIELLGDSTASYRALGLLVVLFALWPLCGHLETVAIGTLFGGLWLCLRAAAGDFREPLRILGRVSLAALIALDLSAFLLLPQLHVLEASNRLVLAKSSSHFDYVPWVPYRPGWLGGFLTSLFPLAFGDLIESPMIPGAAGSIVEMGFGYFSVIGWSCALLVLRSGSRRGARRWILLGLVLFGLGAGMGLPLFRTVTELLPGIRLVPPLRLLLLVSTAGAPLAAIELDRLIANRSSDRRAAGFLIAILLTIAALATSVFTFFHGKYVSVGAVSSQTSVLLWTLAALIAAGVAAMVFAKRAISGRALATLLTAIAAAELLHQGMRLYRFYLPTDLYPETPLVRFLRSRPLPYRVVGDQSALFPNTNIFALVENVGTHDPAERRDYVEFLNQSAGYPPFDYFKSIADLNSPALDFLNARYLVTPPGRQAPGQKWSLVYGGSDGNVFENRQALPRFFSPRSFQVVISGATGTQRTRNAMVAFGTPLKEFLAAGQFHDKALVLEGNNLSRLPSEDPNGHVEIRELLEQTNRIRFAASVSTSSGRAILVSSLVTDGGWSASDELGNPLGVTLANGPFLAVVLPAGDHLITLSYVSPGFRLGVAISIATLGAFATLVLLRGKGA